MKSTVEILRNPSQIEPLEEAWNALLTTSALPFQSFGWHRSLLRLLNPDDRKGLRIYVLKDKDDTPIAILPCFLKGKNLQLMSDSYGVSGDVIAKQKEAAEELFEAVLDEAMNEGLSLQLNGLSENSFLRRAFEKRVLDETQSILIKPDQSHSYILIEDNTAEVEIENREFFLGEDEEISKNLLLEIGQFQQAHGHPKSNFSREEFIPFLNFLCLSKVGISIATLRDENRDLLAFDLGFRKGRCFHLLYHLTHHKLATAGSIHCLRQLHLNYLGRKGVRQFHLVGEENCKSKAGFPTNSGNRFSCSAYSEAHAQQIKFRLLNAQQNVGDQVASNYPIIMIRLKLLGIQIGKKIGATYEASAAALSSATSRIKERLSSSSVAK